MGIQVKNIFYTYQKKATNATQALMDVSLEIKDNDFYRSAATYVTSEEISEIYDSILPKKKTRGNCGIALPDAAGNRGRRP